MSPELEAVTPEGEPTNVKLVWIIFVALLLSSCVEEGWEDTFFRVGGEIASETGPPPDGCFITLRQTGTDPVLPDESAIRVQFLFAETFVGQYESGKQYFLEITCDGYDAPQRTKAFTPEMGFSSWPKPYDLGKIVMKK